MACIWWGVQAWLGGQCVYVFLRCLFPSIANIPNKMPAYTETTSAYILCFVIYWLLSLPTIWVPIHKLRWWFLAKAVIAPIIGFALFGWSITRAGGVGPVFGQPSSLKGSSLSWQMLISISSCFNNMFTLSKFSLPTSSQKLIGYSHQRARFCFSRQNTRCRRLATNHRSSHGFHHHLFPWYRYRFCVRTTIRRSDLGCSPHYG